MYQLKKYTLTYLYIHIDMHQFAKKLIVHDKIAKNIKVCALFCKLSKRCILTWRLHGLTQIFQWPHQQDFTRFSTGA